MQNDTDALHVLLALLFVSIFEARVVHCDTVSRVCRVLHQVLPSLPNLGVSFGAVGCQRGMLSDASVEKLSSCCRYGFPGAAAKQFGAASIRCKTSCYSCSHASTTDGHNSCCHSAVLQPTVVISGIDIAPDTAQQEQLESSRTSSRT